MLATSQWLAKSTQDQDGATSRYSAHRGVISSYLGHIIIENFSSSSVLFPVLLGTVGLLTLAIPDAANEPTSSSKGHLALPLMFTSQCSN